MTEDKKPTDMGLIFSEDTPGEVAIHFIKTIQHMDHEVYPKHALVKGYTSPGYYFYNEDMTEVFGPEYTHNASSERCDVWWRQRIANNPELAKACGYTELSKDDQSESTIAGKLTEEEKLRLEKALSGGYGCGSHVL